MVLIVVVVVVVVFGAKIMLLVNKKLKVKKLRKFVCDTNIYYLKLYSVQKTIITHYYAPHSCVLHRCIILELPLHVLPPWHGRCRTCCPVPHVFVHAENAPHLPHTGYAKILQSIFV